MSEEITFEEVLETEEDGADGTDDRPELSEEDKDAVIKKLRDENAKTRIKLRDAEKDQEELKEIRKSQMTELERAQADVEELRTQLKTFTYEKDLDRAVRESGLDPEYADLLEGDYSDYDAILAKAEKLAARLPSKKDKDVDEDFARRSGPADFFGGSEGKEPADGRSSGGGFLEGLWRNPTPN